MRENFLYLLIAKGLTIVLPLLIFPFLFRVLGAENYGLIIWIFSMAQILIVLIKFGFDTIGVRFISENYNHLANKSNVISQITYVKLILFSFAFLGTVTFLGFNRYQEYEFLIYYFLLYVFMEAMFPIWYFQGLEKLRFVAFCSGLPKLIFAASVLMLINQPDDYELVPILYSISSAVTLAMGIYMLKRDSISLVKINIEEVYELVKEGGSVFLASVSAVMRDRLTAILIAKYLGLESLAYFDLVTKLVNALLTPFHVLNNVFYPRFVKTKNLITFTKILFISIICSTSLVIGIFLCKELIISLLAGSQNFEMNKILPIMLFAVPLGSTIAFISTNLLIAYNKTKWLLYSALITLIFYGFSFLIMLKLNMFQIEVFAFLYVVMFLIQLTTVLYGARDVILRKIRYGN